MRVFIEELNQAPVSEQKIEMVERKGIGHPDSLTDAICEASSRILCQYYLENKGFICHHNLDKGLLVGGVSDVTFGGGSIIERPDATGVEESAGSLEGSACIYAGSASARSHLRSDLKNIRESYVNISI